MGMQTELLTTEDKLAEALTVGLRKHLEDEVRKRLTSEMEKVMSGAVTEVCRNVMARVKVIDNRLADRTEIHLILDGVKSKVDLSEPATARIP